MTYITSVDRIGIRKGKEEGILQGLQQGMQEGMQQGLQQGLATERQLLLRQIRHRFGQEVAERSTSLLAQVTAPEVLEDLGELLLDCNDGQTWLQALSERAVGGEK